MCPSLQGAVNYMAVTEALDVTPSVFGAGLAADDLILTLYFTTIYALAKAIPPDPGPSEAVSPVQSPSKTIMTSSSPSSSGSDRFPSETLASSDSLASVQGTEADPSASSLQGSRGISPGMTSLGSSPGDPSTSNSSNGANGGHGGGEMKPIQVMP